MGRYILQRIIAVLPIAFGVTVICFVLMFIAPGDPLQTLIPDNAPPDVVALLKHQYGLDQPLPVQYLVWLSNALRGNLGVSIGTGRPVAQELGTALLNTAIVALSAAVVGFALGIVLGLIAGYRRGQWPDRIASAIAVAGVSVPQYWVGIVLVIVFSVEFNWLPAMGMGPSGISFAWTDLSHLIMPVATLALIPMGIVTRIMRDRVADLLRMDFVRTLRAQGLPERVVLRFILKNAAPPVLAVMGLQLGYLFGGSILVETVFNWPGVGFVMSNAILRRDQPMLQGAILVLALLFVAFNLVVDILQTSLDKRIRRG
jgi:peptide/nickel transport system permease protein